MAPVTDTFAERIRDAEAELVREVKARRRRWHYEVHRGRVRFDREVRRAHKRLRQGVLPFLWQSDALSLLTAPVVYSLAIPLVALDLWTTVYQWVCFPVFGIPRVRRRAYFVIDRHKLAYLNAIEKVHCAYCSYANGLLAYVREVAARTEQYWCPIKHARVVIAPHRRYRSFLDYGDAGGYRREPAGHSRVAAGRACTPPSSRQLMRGGVDRFVAVPRNMEETMTVLTNAGVLTAMLALTAVAVVAGQHVVLTDQQIKLEVEHKLMDERITGVSVDVRDRVVTLGGTVANLWARDEASEEAREVTDVEEVVNLLGVRRAESDKELAANLAEKVQRHVFLSIFDDIDVEVADGVATLRGFVTMPFKTREIMALTSRVDGVQNIIDKVETLPVSSFDDQIRYALASRIYNDPMFWHYAIHVNPPIHLIVQHGRVTLTGVVASEVERRKAEFLARGVFGVFSVENRLRLES